MKILEWCEYGEERGEVFVARDVGNSRKDTRKKPLARLMHEIKKLIDDAYALAKDLLIENSDKLKLLAEALLEYETLDAQQVKDLMKHGEDGEPAIALQG